jgi:nucleoside-diphosphate-sugar epimerase
MPSEQVLVVGGTGFVGALLVRALHGLGHDVTVYHRGRHEPELPLGVRHVRSESAAIPVLHFPDELRRAEFSVVVLVVPLGGADAGAAVDAFRGRAGRLVAISSGDVYAAYGELIGTEPAPGKARPALLAESAPLRSVLYPYGRRVEGPWGELRDYEKILVERAVLGDAALPGTVLRLPKVYGPGDVQHVFAPYVRRMADRRPFILLGERQAAWRWTHGYVENVAWAVALATIDHRAAGRTYNVGEQPTPTFAERVRALGHAAGWQGEIVTVPDDQLPGHLRGPLTHAVDLAYDTTAIRSELGYEEPVAYEDGLRRTVAWERDAMPAANRAALDVDYAAEDETRDEW